jgi:hypothetical protein
LNLVLPQIQSTGQRRQQQQTLGMRRRIVAKLSIKRQRPLNTARLELFNRESECLFNGEYWHWKMLNSKPYLSD